MRELINYIDTIYIYLMKLQQFVFQFALFSVGKA